MVDVKRAFVLGHPITHSRSPLIHNHWIKTYGLHASYEAIDVAPGTLPEFLTHVRSGEFVGGNVTVPLKEEAFAAVDALTKTAKSIGAVNTVYMEDGRLWGDNTDAYGFSANLADKAAQWSSLRIALVIGAGGAARAIVKSLVDANFKRIFVLNRTLSRAKLLETDFGTSVVAGPLADFAIYAKTADVIINTSSLGMAGKEDMAFDFSKAQTSSLVTDIVYVPLETSFLKSARLAGLKTVDGLGMLLHQAVPGFERWFGVRPEVTPELRSLIEADLFKVKS
ncbi:MAG: shikimate dehydrogenase [Notoacmeibacter sp.]